MNATERQPYLETMDAILLPLGFTRKRREFEWRRGIDRDTEWIHLNFGKEVINPSFGVRYGDLEALFPTEFGVRCGPWAMLSGRTGVSYSATTTPPAAIAGDLSMVIQEMPNLRDRQAFADALLSEKPTKKFVLLFSDRIRMAPVLLAHLGRLEEAFAWLARFESIAHGRDHMLPSYESFAAHFRSVFKSPQIERATPQLPPSHQLKKSSSSASTTAPAARWPRRF